MDYFNKYIKYKKKYLNLKNMIGGVDSWEELADEEEAPVDILSLPSNPPQTNVVSIPDIATREVLITKYLSKYGDHIPGISSFEKEHLIKHGVKKNHIINVPVSSISMINLLKKFNIQSLDLLYIDAEGYDANIVIDFLKTTSIRPIIILEYIHVEKTIFETMINILEKENYTLFTINENLLCYPKKDKQFIKFN